MQERRPVSTRDVRTSLSVILAGSVIFWIGIPWPIGPDYWDAESDAERVLVVDENRVEFAISFGLLGLGALIAAIGLWLLGRAITEVETETARWRGIAAQTAAWLGLLGVLSGAGRLLAALFATPEFNVDNDIDVVLGVAGGLGTTAALIIFGVLAWSAPPPRWTAAVLVLGGVLGAVTFLPLFWYLALIVFAIANLIVMRRRARAEGRYGVGAQS